MYIFRHFKSAITPFMFSFSKGLFPFNIDGNGNNGSELQFHPETFLSDTKYSNRYSQDKVQ